MQELHVTVAGSRHDVPRPFHVLATQNPIEQEGTYPLPEAQLDRFLMQIDVDYPDREAERKIVFDTTGNEESKPKPTMTADELLTAQRLVRRLPVGESVVEAILSLVRSARPDSDAGDVGKLISWGPSPRASQALMLVARARALIDGRLSPSIDDVLDIAGAIFKHRMALTFAARGNILYVREQEWEAAHTVWIWADRSPSMYFTSSLAQESKLDRTLVIAFALAEVLVQGGERVGVPGLVRPTGSRNVLDKMANAIVHDVTERASLPPSFAPSSLAEIVVVSDFCSPMTDVRKTLSQLSATGAHGHTVQIVDPAEETFPYSGRVEFIEPEGAGSITAGRAETWKSDYETRVARHRAEIRAETDTLGWSFTIHRTDRPATERLLALHARLGAPPPGAVVSGRLRIAGQIGRRA